FVAGMTDEDRASHQFECFAAGAIPEAALAHVGDGIGAVQFDRRRVRRPRVAAIVDYRERLALQKGRGRHGRIRSYSARAARSKRSGPSVLRAPSMASRRRLVRTPPGAEKPPSL